MNSEIETSFMKLLSAVQVAKLYGGKHPVVLKAVQEAYASITEVLNKIPLLTVGIVGEEIAFEKEIFFELSKLVKQGIGFLKEKNIEKISFKRGMEFDDLRKFISCLAVPKEETKTSLNDLMLSEGVRNITVGKFTIGAKAAQDNASLSDFLQSKGILSDISVSLGNVFDSEKFDGLALKTAVESIIDNFGPRLELLLRLNALKRYDLGTFTHIINVSILSMYFSSNIGFPKKAVMDIGLSALLHDIGKLYISRKIIGKKEELTFQEFSRIQSHTTLGTSLILQYTDAIGFMPAVVSFEHHLKFDLSGYPKARFPRSQHIVSQIVAICDSYDALSERRSYKADYPPDAIYGIMLRGSGTNYNPLLLDKFFKLIGVWPVGSIVALTDQRVAVVFKENQDDIFSPVVRIIYPGREEDPVDLKGHKDGLKIKCYLNPWTEGKKFLHLV